MSTSPLSQAAAEWEANSVQPLLRRSPERKARFETSSGIPVERLYLPADELAGDYDDQLGFPGEFPFARGVQPTMYRGRFWTMRQYAGFGSAAESNERYQYLIAQGQTGLSVAFDLPTQIGYDADDPMAYGEVGKVGVAISSLADMETLLAGIPLDKVSVSMTINAPAAILLAMVIGAYLTRRRAPDRQVSTTAWGLAILAGPLFLLALSSVMQIQSLLRPLLFVFGAGLGIFSVGGVALLMAMSREQQAGAYLALWSMIQLITRGAGIAAGGLLRDLGLAVTGSLSLAYGFVFAFEAVGLLVCILLLRRVDVPGFVSLSTRAEAVALPTPAVFD